MRAAVLVLIAFLMMSLAIPEVLISFGIGGTLGLTLQPNDPSVVRAVVPTGPALGILRPGDVIDFAALDPGARVHLRRGIVRGEEVAVPIRRDGAARVEHITAAPSPVSEDDAWAKRATALITIITGILGVMALFRRPDILGFALFCVCIGAGSGNAWVKVAPPGWSSLIAILPLIILATAQVVGFTLFCTRFSIGKVSLSTRMLERVMLLAVGVGTMAYVVYLFGYAFPVNTTGDGYRVEAIIFLIVYITAYALYLRRVPSFDGEARLRARWITIGLTYQVVLAVAFTSLQLLTQIGKSIPPSVSTWLNVVAPAPYVMAYALFGLRIVDPRVIGARALVYGAFLFVIGTAIALFEWRTGSFIDRWAATLPGELKGLAAGGLVVAVALGLNAVHHRIEILADVIFFAKRRRAERELANVALGLPAASGMAIDHALTEIAAEKLELASAALFAQREEFLERVGEYGWAGCDDRLDASEPFVLAARETRCPVRIADFPLGKNVRFPGGDATPSEAIPAVVRGELTAMAIYGYTVHGEPLAPSQHNVLVKLVDAASRAYERAEVTAQRTINDALSKENAELRRQVAALQRQDQSLAPPSRKRGGRKGGDAL